MQKIRKFLLPIVIITLGAVLLLPTMLPVALALIQPEIVFLIETDDRDLYITIDDSPSRHTPLILNVLEKHEVEATFFITGSRVRSKEEIDTIKEGGHAVGNHLLSTKACSTLSFAEFREDFEACNAIIGDTKLFRPPSDFGKGEQIEYVKNEGFDVFMGTVFPLDHWMSNPDYLVVLSKWLATDGGILILHDGDERGEVTAKVLDRIIPALKAKGYTFKQLTNSR